MGGLKLEGGASACAALGLRFDTPTTLGEIDVFGSGAAERVDWPRLVVTSSSEHFGTVAWIGGFTARPPALTGAIRVEVAARQADSMTGDFGRLVDRTADSASAWTVPVSARFPDGGTQLVQVVLERDLHGQLDGVKVASVTASGGGGGSSSDARFAAEGDAVVVDAVVGQASRIRLGTHVGVDVPAGAVAKPTQIRSRSATTSVASSVPGRRSARWTRRWRTLRSMLSRPSRRRPRSSVTPSTAPRTRSFTRPRSPSTRRRPSICCSRSSPRPRARTHRERLGSSWT